MTATQSFIEDGGVVLGGTHMTLEEALLDPKVWQAVGKQRGWEKVIDWTPLSSVHCARCGETGHEVSMGTQRTWKYNMHSFIDHLADGKSIEEALVSL